MQKSLIELAQWGDLKGMQLAGLARMSEEIVELDPDAIAPTDLASFRPPRTGADIKGREVQTQDCENYTLARGGIYVHTYQEPDTSAWKRKRVVLPDGTVGWRVERPVFESALEDLKRGFAPDGKRLDGLVVYDLDRLTRDLRHLEDAIDVVMHYGRPILDTTGTIDLLTENGRSMARVMVTMSAKQSADTSRRVTRKHQALQAAGIPAGGRRPFGWAKDKRKLNPDEAPLLEDAAKRILEGAKVSEIVLEWTAKGILTPSGNRWEIGSLRNCLRNPRICGYRARVVRAFDTEHATESQSMEIVLDTEGKPVIGQWDTILSVEQWEALTIIIGRRGTPAKGKGTSNRIYLLSGTLRCGREGCNEKLRAMKAMARDNKTPGYFYYGCRSLAQGGCGGVSISGPPVDKHIEELVFQKYEAEAAKRSANTDATQEWEGEARFVRLAENRKQAYISWKDPNGISPAAYFAQVAEFEAEERQLKAERNIWRARIQAKSSHQPENIRAEWASYTLSQRVNLIENVLVTVIVKPAHGRSGQYRERLEPIWREES